MINEATRDWEAATAAARELWLRVLKVLYQRNSRKSSSSSSIHLRGKSGFVTSPTSRSLRYCADAAACPGQQQQRHREWGEGGGGVAGRGGFMCFGQQRLLNINTLSAQALFEDCNWSMNIGSTTFWFRGGKEGRGRRHELTSWLVAQHQFDTLPKPLHSLLPARWQWTVNQSVVNPTDALTLRSTRKFLCNFWQATWKLYLPYLPKKSALTFVV